MSIYKTAARLVQAGTVALGLAVATVAFATANRECGDSGPACDGECPAGQRCITSAMSGSATTIFPHRSARRPAEQASEEEGCRCAEVRCGGELLKKDEGCCNGQTYTLGVFGCCAGFVIPVNEPCSCSGDLATQACCSLTIDGGSATTIFDPRQHACCQRTVIIDGIQGIVQTDYSFSTGFDCCGGPMGVSFCAGSCQGAACVTSGCCACSSCELGNGDHCVGADTPEGCDNACFLDTCDGDRQIQGGVCRDGAGCGAGAPAASRLSLLLLVGALGAIAMITLARRKTRTSAS